MNDTRRAYEAKIAAELKEWNRQIALFKARADKARAEAKIEYYKTIEVLEQRQAEASAKLEELTTAGDEAWKDLKAGAEKAWDEIKTTFHEAASRFK